MRGLPLSMTMCIINVISSQSTPLNAGGYWKRVSGSVFFDIFEHNEVN